MLNKVNEKKMFCWPTIPIFLDVSGNKQLFFALQCIPLLSDEIVILEISDIKLAEIIKNLNKKQVTCIL